MQGVVHSAAQGLEAVNVVDALTVSNKMPANEFSHGFDNHNGTTGSHGKL